MPTCLRLRNKQNMHEIPIIYQRGPISSCPAPLQRGPLTWLCAQFSTNSSMGQVVGEIRVRRALPDQSGQDTINRPSMVFRGCFHYRGKLFISWLRRKEPRYAYLATLRHAGCSFNPEDRRTSPAFSAQRKGCGLSVYRALDYRVPAVLPVPAAGYDLYQFHRYETFWHAGMDRLAELSRVVQQQFCLFPGHREHGALCRVGYTHLYPGRTGSGVAFAPQISRQSDLPRDLLPAQSDGRGCHWRDVCAGFQWPELRPDQRISRFHPPANGKLAQQL